MWVKCYNYFLKNSWKFEREDRNGKVVWYFKFRWINFREVYMGNKNLEIEFFEIIYNLEKVVDIFWF